MRITRSSPAKRASKQDLIEIFASIQNNAAIASYEIKVDKVADVNRIITRDTTGRTTAQTLISKHVKKTLGITQLVPELTKEAVPNADQPATDSLHVRVEGPVPNAVLPQLPQQPLCS